MELQVFLFTVVGLLTVSGVVYLAYDANKRGREREAQRQAKDTERQVLADLRMELRDIVNRHLDALQVKRRQKLRRDDYGNWVEGPWVQEKAYFWQTVVSRSPEGGFFDLWFGPEAFAAPDATYSIIDELMDELARSRPEAPAIDIDTLSPEAFEGYCVQLLAEDGWDAVAGGGSGDQGVDIVATKNGVKAVFQCKKYSQPVGNKAVQEALAGKAYASADLAFVVSNASFTKSAYALANAAEVFLVHYTQLEDLSEYMAGLRSQ